MAIYKKILVALDAFQNEESPIIDKVREIQAATQAELHLVHVVEELYTYGVPPFPSDVTDWQQDFVVIAKTKLEKLGTLLGVPKYGQHTPVGSPKEMIVEVAKEIKADLIILGSHGREGISYILLGSTANGVLHTAPCDVLSVRIQKEKK